MLAGDSLVLADITGLYDMYAWIVHIAPFFNSEKYHHNQITAPRIQGISIRQPLTIDIVFDSVIIRALVEFFLDVEELLNLINIFSQNSRDTHHVGILNYTPGRS